MLLDILMGKIMVKTWHHACALGGEGFIIVITRMFGLLKEDLVKDRDICVATCRGALIAKNFSIN
jgi:hypothetical protein